LDLKLQVSSLEFLILGMQGFEPKAAIDADNDPLNGLQAAAQDGKYYGGFIEANLHVSPRLVLIARYDMVRNTQQSDPAFAKATGDIDQWVAAVRQALNISTRTDVWVHAEVSSARTRQDAGAPDLRAISGMLALDIAF
jgi:hypothetical protein